MRVLVAVRDKDLIGGKTLCYLGLYKIETFEGVRPAEHGFLVFRCKMKRCDTEPLPPATLKLLEELAAKPLKSRQRSMTKRAKEACVKAAALEELQVAQLTRIERATNAIADAQSALSFVRARFSAFFWLAQSFPGSFRQNPEPAWAPL